MWSLMFYLGYLKILWLLPTTHRLTGDCNIASGCEGVVFLFGKLCSQSVVEVFEYEMMQTGFTVVYLCE